MDEFIDLKERQEKNKIEDEYSTEIVEIRNEDEMFKKIKALEEEFKAMYKLEGYERRVKLANADYLTPMSEEKINKIYKEKTEKLDGVTEKFKEIRALCKGANHSEKMEIYKMYGLIEG